MNWTRFADAMPPDDAEGREIVVWKQGARVESLEAVRSGVAGPGAPLHWMDGEGYMAHPEALANRFTHWMLIEPPTAS